MIRTSFDFCAALLGATVLYVIGDVLAGAEIRRDSHALHCAGCLLVAMGCRARGARRGAGADRERRRLKC